METKSKSSFKGVSTLISTVTVILLVFLIATAVTPWALDLTRDMTNSTEFTADEQIVCQGTSFDYDSNYGSSGISYNFTGTVDSLQAKIINTGSQNLYGFTFEITLNTTAIERVELTSATQKTKSNPLRPGESAIINATLTKNYNETLSEVKVINNVCKKKYINQEL